MVALGHRPTIIFVNHPEPRRRSPRILVDGLCGVASNDFLRPAVMRDLSLGGVRLERPFDAATARHIVQLEIDLPGIDEVVWASGVVSFALLTPRAGRTLDGQPRFWVRAGVRLDNMCRREQRMLHDYVRENENRPAL